MPRFEPFRGLRYDPERVDLSDVMAPPYDVIDEEERSLLEAKSPYNAVRVELPRDATGHDRYEEARCLLEQWRQEGVVTIDEEPSFYVYRMGFIDTGGRARQTSGVIGALGLEAAGGDVLPHEHTTAKPKDDRLNLLRSCRANLSPIWGLSLSEGLSGLCELPGPPDSRATDDQGVHHRLWRVHQSGVVQAISEAVAATPVMIADGHHRYETGLAYRDEQRAAGAGEGAHDLIMALIVELADDQLAVRPIHRLLRGTPPADELLAAWQEHFDPFETGPADETLDARMADAEALALVTSEGTWLLRPKDGAFPGVTDLDSARLERALHAVPGAETTFQHGTDTVIGAVAKGDADAAVLLRPASVAAIAATARAREKMPPKTTFFHPKPRTGIVFRPLD